MAYLRLLRRRTSFESNDIQQIINAEFLTSSGKIDLSISVFETDIKSNLLQTNAEITAGNNIDLMRYRAGVDCQKSSGWSGTKTTVTENKIMDFDFTKNAHRELEFLSEEHLIKFVKDLQNSLNQSPIPQVTKQETAHYAHTLYSNGNAEWLRICELSQKARSWVINR